MFNKFRALITVIISLASLNAFSETSCEQVLSKLTSDVLIIDSKIKVSHHTKSLPRSSGNYSVLNFILPKFEETKDHYFLTQFLTTPFSQKGMAFQSDVITLDMINPPSLIKKAEISCTTKKDKLIVDLIMPSGDHFSYVTQNIWPPSKLIFHPQDSTKSAYEVNYQSWINLDKNTWFPKIFSVTHFLPGLKTKMLSANFDAKRVQLYFYQPLYQQILKAKKQPKIDHSTLEEFQKFIDQPYPPFNSKHFRGIIESQL